MTASPVHEAPFDVKETAAALVGLFPALGPEEQRLSLELYRLLADGQPVSIQRLAERLTRHSDEVANTLRNWPGVFFDQQGDVIGYWGLSPSYETTHHQPAESGSAGFPSARGSGKVAVPPGPNRTMQ